MSISIISQTVQPADGGDYHVGPMPNGVDLPGELGEHANTCTLFLAGSDLTANVAAAVEISPDMVNWLPLVDSAGAPVTITLTGGAGGLNDAQYVRLASLPSRFVRVTLPCQGGETIKVSFYMD